MTGPVRLGLLGCADIATRRVLPAVSRSAVIRLVAVASRSAERAAAVAGEFGGDPVTGYDRLLERPDVEAVYAPVPAALHAHWVRAALRAGKHVLAEKPLTTDPAETAELLALARASGLVLCENVMFLRHPQHDRVRRLLASGAIGEPRLFSASFAVPPRPPGDIRLRPELGGGALFDVGVYPLRSALMLLGPGLTVTGAALSTGSASPVDVGGGALLSRPDGVVAQVAFGMEHHYTSRYEVLGSEGRLRLDHAFTPPAEHRPTVLIDRARGTERLSLDPYDQCLGTVESFARAVRSGAGTSGEAVIRQADLLADIRRAAATEVPSARKPADHAVERR